MITTHQLHKKLAAILISLLLGLMVVTGAPPVQAQEPGNILPQHAAGRLLVKPKSGLSINQLEPLKVDLQATTVKQFPLLGAELWHIDGLSVAEAVAQFSDDPRLEYLEPDYQITVAPLNDPNEPQAWPTVGDSPNDTYFSSLWGLHNTGQTFGTADADIDAPEAWATQTGNNVLVAVIDTGVDYNHPDLAANIWTNPGEIAGNGLDDDGNGYVDDIHGWDFAYDDNDPMDVAGHGTHCAGTIAAVGNNSRGVTGVNWSARIMALKFLDDSGSGWTTDALEALQYAVLMDAQLTSNSWGGGGYSQAMYDAIAAAGAVNQLFIAAAGNDGTNNDSIPHYPSNYALDNVISVAATDHNDTLSSFSNYGATTVHLGAPGSAIYSTLPGNSYGGYSGTSMATPHVSGAASLIWAQHPSYSYSIVRQLILSGVDSLPALTGKTISGGRLNLQNTLAAPDSTPPATVANLAVSAVGSDRLTLTWTAPGDDGNTGTAAGYDIRYAAVPITADNFASATVIDTPPSPQPAGSTETFIVTGLAAGTQYYFALKTFDEFANESDISNVPAATTLAPPNITVSPASLAATLEEGASTSRTLNLGNTGDSDLFWQSTVLLAGLNDDFDPDIDSNQWTEITGGESRTSCGAISGEALYFDGSASRTATTTDLDTRSGGSLEFYLKLGSGSAPCEMADSGEGITLQYSTDGGATWNIMAYYNAGSYADFTHIETEIPEAAQTAATRFRWAQLIFSGAGYDNWAVDNIRIGNSGYANLAPETGTVSPAGGQAVTVNINAAGLTAGTYNATILLESNDPDDNPVEVPLALTVEPPPPPDIGVSPAAVEVTMLTEETATRTLTIANNGEGPLSFSLAVAGAEAIAKSLTAQENGIGWQPVDFPSDKIDPALQQDLSLMSGEPADFLVYLTEQADLSAAYNIDNWAERGRYVYDTLYQTAQQSQPDIIAFLGQEAVLHKFYIVNAIAATGSIDTITGLANRADVVYIEALDSYALPEPQPGANIGIAGLEWGVSKIGADRVWADFDIWGDGMVIASIDTGVYSSHPALINQYRGTATGSHDYNWFDPSYTYPAAPGDNNGHGTHTVGTMVGADGTSQPGVAPAAQWIAAKGCGSSTCDSYDLLYAAEWMLAPYPIGGTAGNGDPTRRPHVINNSWGGGGGDLWYQTAVQAWRAAGIFPAFAAGNAGDEPGTIGSPGDYADSFASGATDSSDNITAFSSRGPSSLTSETKPDISAPGSAIRSTWPDGGYASMSGTSMASPHTAGCAALVMEADPTLEVSQVEDLLTSTAADLGATGPDDAFGYGRLDCYQAVAAARAGVVGWLTAGPGSGQVAPGGSLDIELDLNSTGLDLGDYEATLTITSNDPDESPLVIPITLHVTDCAAGAVIPPGPTVYMAAGPFTVTTVISDVTDLGGFEFDMQYDPTLLHVTGVSLADFPASTGRSVTPVGPVVDNSGGLTTFGAFSMGSTAGPSGNGALAWVTFEPQQTGQSSLNLQNLQATDSAGETLPTCPVNKQVNIEACYPVDFDCDCDVDINDVLDVAQSWSCRAGTGCYTETHDLDQDQDIDIVDIMRVVPHWGWDCADSTGPTQTPTSSESATAATISLNPALPNITTPGQVITVDVLIEGANTLGGFEFDVAFPADMVQVDEVMLGGFLTSGDIHPLTPIVDNEAGTVSFGGFSIGATGHNGSGTLGTITFIASQTGQPELTLEGAQLATTEGETQPVETAVTRVFLPLIVK